MFSSVLLHCLYVCSDLCSWSLRHSCYYQSLLGVHGIPDNKRRVAGSRKTLCWHRVIASLHISTFVYVTFLSGHNPLGNTMLEQNIPETMKWTAYSKWTWEGLEKTYADVKVKVSAHDGKDLLISLAEFLRSVMRAVYCSTLSLFL